MEYRVYVQFPTEHTGHLMGELAGYSQHIDADLVSKIRELVDDGVRSLDAMKRHLTTYVEHEILPEYDNVEVARTNRRFYPTDKDIRNHMYLAITETKYIRYNIESLATYKKYAAKG